MPQCFDFSNSFAIRLASIFIAAGPNGGLEDQKISDTGLTDCYGKNRTKFRQTARDRRKLSEAATMPGQYRKRPVPFGFTRRPQKNLANKFGGLSMSVALAQAAKSREAGGRISLRER